MKTILFSGLALLLCSRMISQVLYSNNFGGLSLQSYTAGTSVVLYTTAPVEFQLINDGYPNNAGTNLNPNAPFNVPALKTAGWVVGYNSALKDTFLVSTSWLDDASLTSSKWILTPTINVSANTVITWLAMSPDVTYPDGYEMYATNKTGSLTANDFAIGDRIFHMPDAQTPGGGEKNTWTRRSVYLGNFAGQTLRFAFKNHSKNMFQLWLDDIEIKNITLAKEAELTTVLGQRYFLTNSSQTVGVSLMNNGAMPINTVVLNYQYGNSSVNSQTFSVTDGVNYGQSSNFSFALPYSITQPGCYLLKCWISSVNGSPDQNLATDTVKTFVTSQTVAPLKNVLMEQFVSAYDGESVDAQQKALGIQSDRFVVVNIHTTDSLKENNNALVNDYFQRNSTAMIDRVYFGDVASGTVDRTYYNTKLSDRVSAVTPASVSIRNKLYYDPTRSLNFDVRVDFAGEVKGDYRINVYLVENNVAGKASDTTVNGYNQLSNYYNIPWSPFYQTGYFSPIANAWVLEPWRYKHQNVLIHSFAGSYGVAGVIPSNGGTQGQGFQQNFTLTVPTPTNGISKYNADNMYLVAFVAEYNANKTLRSVLNVTKEKMTPNGEVVGITENVKPLNMSVYPNPSVGDVYVSGLNVGESYELTVREISGKAVKKVSLKNPGKTEKLDLNELASGLYIVEVVGSEYMWREKVLLAKTLNR